MPYTTNGPPYVSTGLAAAASRLDHALQAGGANEAFVAIFETVMWLVVMDERFRATPGYLTHRQGAGAEVLDGCWHVWNLLKHRGLDRVVDITPGAGWPAEWPLRWAEVTWKAFDALPLMDEKHRRRPREASYQHVLQGKPVRATLPAAISLMQSWLLSAREDSTRAEPAVEARSDAN